MENDLNDLSASDLRRLLLMEIRLFIDYLDNGSAEELQGKKDHLKKILSQLTEKEQIEMAPLIWGKNTHNIMIGQPDPDTKPTSEDGMVINPEAI